MNALRRFKYRHLLRIGARDLLGDADLAGTTEELSHLADACIAQALGEATATVREAHGAPIGAAGSETGVAVVAMGKLGGDELNYSSDVDLMFVYGEDGETAGGRAGRLANGEYFTRVCRELVSLLEEIDGRGLRVPCRSAPASRRADGPDRPLARRLSRLLSRARRAMGAAGADQVAHRRG